MEQIEYVASLFSLEAVTSLRSTSVPEGTEHTQLSADTPSLFSSFHLHMYICSDLPPVPAFFLAPPGLLAGDSSRL